MVTLHTNFGDIKLELYPEQAPETVANFLDYCKEGFYDGTLFHRVIPGFMIQGGGMLSGMQEKKTKKPIQNEANNGLKNDKGTIAMARTMAPHSATSQFFINANDNGFLNFTAENPEGWGYCVFGKVVEGIEIVEKIEKVKTGRAGHHQDVPNEDVVIESTTLED